MSSLGNPQILGATSEDVCKHYEHGLQAPGMGYRLRWDDIEENRTR